MQKNLKAFAYEADAPDDDYYIYYVWPRKISKDVFQLPATDFELYFMPLETYTTN